MDVTFAVDDRTFTVPERQAIILAENLRLLATSDADEVQAYVQLSPDDSWRDDATTLADSIERALVGPVSEPLPLEGGAAHATHRILRLMIGLESSFEPVPADGLRDAQGTPVGSANALRPSRHRGGRARARVADQMRFLSAPELTELLIVLFALAVLTVVAVAAGVVAWYVIGPVIAGLLGLRVASTRVKGKAAWAVASVFWWTIFLIPATILVLLVSLLILVILR